MAWTNTVHAFWHTRKRRCRMAGDRVEMSTCYTDDGRSSWEAESRQGRRRLRRFNVKWVQGNDDY
ncbi:hypothetical protein SELSPUOL_01924 [Selenomonas sputigena ATCC 35185]|uniref:Uncharacterized protein n=1 Tax=Selenomonas sputigena (strain ATCC 35185 / DSM 20758 / CCUG 44933 / VPI D19B-28) TaxID=546271 RepID=C9LWR9_SELS3|nr:hypothetical protein SELSPUOL_01924 [Selenomonas sputigena ATCC 35185]